VKETRSGDNVSSSTLTYTFKPKKTSSEVINGVDYNRQSSEVPKMYFDTVESLVFNYISGGRLVDNSFNSPSVDLVSLGYPGVSFFNSYLHKGTGNTHDNVNEFQEAAQRCTIL